MKSFRVILNGKSALKMVNKKNWKGSNYQMTVQDHWKDAKKEQPPHHLGLIYTVELQAKDASSSITKANAFARRICDELTATNRAIVDHPEPQFALDVEAISPERELVQVVYNCPLLHKPLKEMDNQKYRSFFEKMDGLRKSDSKMASRITRALYYFRESLLHSDPIDRFEDAWVALEVLGSKIREKFELSTKQPVKCEGCGKVSDIPSSAAGVDYIFETLLKEDPSLAISLRNKRNGIQHGFSHLGDALEDILEFTEVAHKGVMAGVGELLGFPVGEGIGISKPFLPIVGSAPMLIRAFLHDLPIEKVNGVESYPQLAIHCVEKIMKNQKEEHLGQQAPLALQVLVKMNNYGGLWDLQGVGFDFVLDSKDSNTPQIIAQKWNV